jgi:hypothetical protein
MPISADFLNSMKEKASYLSGRTGWISLWNIEMDYFLWGTIKLMDIKNYQHILSLTIESEDQNFESFGCLEWV